MQTTRSKTKANYKTQTNYKTHPSPRPIPQLNHRKRDIHTRKCYSESELLLCSTSSPLGLRKTYRGTGLSDAGMWSSSAVHSPYLYLLIYM
jgi:hypothetical protein